MKKLLFLALLISGQIFAQNNNWIGINSDREKPASIELNYSDIDKLGDYF